MAVTKLSYPAKENAVQEKINEIIDNMSGTITIDQTYNGTSTNPQSGVAIEGELSSHYQERLIDGTNIKTINMIPLLGSGNIVISDIFIATYGTTTLQEIYTAYGTGYTVFCKITDIANIGFRFASLVRIIRTSMGVVTSAVFSYCADNKIYTYTVTDEVTWTTTTKNLLISSDLPTNHVTTDTSQIISANKTFQGDSKLLSFRGEGDFPSIGMDFGKTTSNSFLYYTVSRSVDSLGGLLQLSAFGNNAPQLALEVETTNYCYRIVTPTANNAEAPFNLSSTFTNFYFPLGFTDGTNTVKTANTGLVDISTLLPDVSNFVTNTSLATTLSSYATQQWTIEQASALATDLQTWVTNQGYTSNVGTVTSVNNTQPDANGNVTIQTGGTVDQTYDGTSANAQSGVAIEGAGFLKNTATATNSLTILGTTNNQNNSILIGYSTTTSSTNSTVIGNTAVSGGSYATALGYYARANDQYTTAIGNSSYASYQDTTAVGHNSQATAAGTLAVGSNSKATAQRATSIGYSSQATQYQATALGYEAKATANSALQIGTGTNSTANTLQVASYTLLNTSTGLIPDARISSNIARTSAIPTVPTNISAFTNDSGYITGITSSNVTTALGYTPANSTLSNVSSIDSSSVVATALDEKVNTSDIWYDSTTSTLYIGVAQS